MKQTNRRWVLAKRPASKLDPDDLVLKEETVPELQPGQVLVKNTHLSCDPTQLMWMKIDTYLPRIEIGETIRALGYGEVIASKDDYLQVGDRVSGLLGWQDLACLSPATSVIQKLSDSIPPEAALSVLGLTGLTAYFGMHVCQPKAGETVLVSGAAGATGSIAAQIAKISGAKVFGTTGSSEKGRWLVETAGLDGFINYRDENMADRLGQLAPNGLDVYFDNVGGPLLDLALAGIRKHGRILLCGAISQYEGMDEPYRLRNSFKLIEKNATMYGLLYSEHLEKTPQALQDLSRWLSEDKLKYSVDIQDGLENAPTIYNRLFTGANVGKQLIRV